MYNVVFIDVEKLTSDLVDPSSIIPKLNELAANIAVIAPENKNVIVLTSHSTDRLYDINLLKSYFQVLAKTNPSIIVGDVIVREDEPNEKIGGVFHHLERRMLDQINAIGKDNIDYIIHITNGIDIVLLEKVIDKKNIVLTEGYTFAETSADKSSCEETDVTFLISSQSGLDGYNDCFDAYFAYKNRQNMIHKRN